MVDLCKDLILIGLIKLVLAFSGFYCIHSTSLIIILS